MKIKLARAVDVDGKSIEEIDLNLDPLTGADMEFCLREAVAASGAPVVSPLIDTGFHAEVAARAAGITRTALRKLDAKSYLEVITHVQGFLLGTD